MKWGVRRAALRDDNVRSLRKQYQKDNRASERATGRYLHTRFGKKRVAAATADMLSKQTKAKASEKKYKSAYNKAKVDAISKLGAKGYDKKTAARVAKMSAGEAVLQSMLLGGSYGALKYNKAKGAGLSTGKAIVKGLIGNSINNATFGLMSVADGAVSKKRNKDQN